MFGIDLGALIGNPLESIGGALVGGAVGLIVYQLYKLVKRIINPVKYVDALYDLADQAILSLDNTFIDMIRNPDIKEDIQKDMISVLKSRRHKIDNLISKISD